MIEWDVCLFSLAQHRVLAGRGIASIKKKFFPPIADCCDLTESEVLDVSLCAAVVCGSPTRSPFMALVMPLFIISGADS